MNYHPGPSDDSLLLHSENNKFDSELGVLRQELQEQKNYFEKRESEYKLSIQKLLKEADSYRRAQDYVIDKNARILAENRHILAENRRILAENARLKENCDNFVNLQAEIETLRHENYILQNEPTEAKPPQTKTENPNSIQANSQNPYIIL